MSETCRFDVRRYPGGQSPAWFEVFDRMTGTTVASEMSRPDAEAEARRRNHDPSEEPSELLALRAAIDAFVARAGHHSLILVAQAAEALDDVREELARTDRLIAEQQARIGHLRQLFPDPDAEPLE